MTDERMGGRAAFVEGPIKGLDKTLVSLEARTQLRQDEPYRYLYFNHMNLALKDSLRTGGKAVRLTLSIAVRVERL